MKGRKPYKPKKKAQRRKMDRLSRPVGVIMEKVVTNGMAKTAVEWAEYLAGKTPGPGTYDVVRKPNWKPEAAGKFSKGKLPISDIDRRVKENVPGPGEYDILSYLEREKQKICTTKLTKGGLMKSDIDWKVQYAKTQPGPSQYDLNDTLGARISGGRFNKGKPKSDIDWKVLAARTSSPGPGCYITGSSTSLTKGSRISKSERWGKHATGGSKPSPGEEFLHGTPGPGSYDVSISMKAHAFKGAPRMRSGKAMKSDVEWRIYEHGSSPGPGHYQIPGTLLRRDGGRFPMAYYPTEPEKECLAKSLLKEHSLLGTYTSTPPCASDRLVHDTGRSGIWSRAVSSIV